MTKNSLLKSSRWRLLRNLPFKALLLSGLLLIMTTLLAAPPQRQPLRFAMEATYPPFAFFNSENQISGFEIDLANALCTLLERPCTFEHQPFESLILNLKFHRSDAIISAMDITPTRAQQVSFTQPYYQNSAIFIVLKGAFQQVESLQAQRIGVQRGSTHQTYILERHPGMQVAAYDSYQNSLIDLQNGRIQAIFADTAVANQWLKQDQHLATLGLPITDPHYFGRGMAIAVRQQDSALLASFDHALSLLKENGTLQALQQRWFH